ncbi:putative ribonuclease H-like domain-containing protein [Tanacetum coccineum]
MENTRRVVPVETTTSNALISCDGLGDYDWSDQAEEGPTNFALMAYSSTSSNSKVSTDSNCSSSCLENVKILKEQNEQLLKDLRTSKINVITYKTEVAITEFRRKLEMAQKQNDEIQLTVEYFKNSSKNLSKLLDCQIVDKCKTGLGYNVVPPPCTGNFMPPKLDLSFSGLEEFVNEHIVSEPTVKKPVFETSEAKASVDKPKAVKKNNGAPIIEDWVSNSEEEDMPQAKIQKKTVKPSFAKIEFIKSKEQVKNPRKTTVKQDKNVNTARPKAVVNTAKPKAVLNAVKGNQVNAVKASACWVWKPKTKVLDHGNPQMDLQDQGVIDSGCSRHMTGNMSYLTDFEEIDGGYVAFGGNPKGGKITGRGTIKTGNLDFENVYFLTDESHVLLKVPRKNNMYSVDLNNIVPKGGLTCLFAKATSDESKLWHRRLGHINFKTINKLVKGNLVRGLPSKLFENDQTCVACQKGKQHRASSRTPQQNGVAKRKNRTLIEAARTILVDYKLPTTFWGEAVNTTCYVQNRVLVTKPHNKTPCEIFLGRKPALGFMIPFGCLVTILNTIDHLGKFDGKANEGFFVGYSINSKSFRVFNSRTRIVEENLHVQFSENTPNIAGNGPDWLFDIDALTKSMNYKPVVAGNQSNGNAGTKACDDAGKARMETVPGKDYILLPLWPADLPFSQNSKSSPDAGFKPSVDNEKKVTEEPGKEGGDSNNDQEKEDDNVNSTNNVNTASDGNNTNNVNVVSSTVNAAGIEVNVVGAKTSIKLPDDPNMPELEDIVYSDDDEDVGAEADMNNLNTFIPVSPIPTTRIHKDHPVEQIIGDLNSAPQTRRMTKNLEEHGLFSSVQQRTNHKDFQNCLFACFLSQEEPKKVIHALKDPSWIEAMQEELLQFKLQEVWTLVDLPNGKRPIGTKWVYRNKKDERGIVIKNKSRLVAQGYIQEEGIDYDEVFAPVAKIEAIRLFLAYASFKDFVVYQMDVKSAFLYGKIEEEVYVCQPPGFEDPNFPDRVLERKNRQDFVYQKEQSFTDVKTTSTPMETQNPLLKDEDSKEVDVHLYRSMIGSLMYLTSLRPDIMYLKGQPKLGLWYPKDSPFDLVAYTDSDYDGASLDRKSTIGDLLTNAFDVKTVNGEQQLQSLVDGKKIVFTEASVRRDLQLDDEEATNQKFSFSKYIFESMVKNLDNAGKFLMCPRFIQVFLNNQLEGMSSHKRIYVTPSHTKNIFAYMRRQGKYFSRRETPLFPTMVVQAQEEMGEGSEVPTDPHYTPIITQPSSSQPQRKQKYRRPKEKDTQVPPYSVPSNPTNVADEAVNEEPSMQLKELIYFCTKLQQRVLNLENTKTAQAQEITSLKKRVKKLEKKGGSRTPKLKRLYKGKKIDDIDVDEDITLENVYDAEMFDVRDLHGDEVFIEKEVHVKEVNVVGKVKTASIATTASAATITKDEITLAQALAELKSVRPKVTTATTGTTKGILIQEPGESTITTTIPSKDKGKGIMVEEPLKMKKKDQTSFDEQEAIRLQAEFDEEVRLARENDESNVALIEE